ncbi:MAG: RecX family transcriptional regulator [Chitinophagaceae bacterium]|nr:RecX family transcriptional regulator [Chitinophagaceae bacterium]
MDQSILNKLQNFCAYQERSHEEVRSKLLAMKIYGEDLELYIIALIEENFLNEQRYACAIARGKFKFKKWGRIKIKYALKQEKVSAYCIQQAMKEIDEDEYEKTLYDLAEKKLASLSEEKNKFAKMTKLKNYLLQKGYETELIHQIVQHQLSN